MNNELKNIYLIKNRRTGMSQYSMNIIMKNYIEQFQQYLIDKRNEKIDDLLK